MFINSIEKNTFIVKQEAARIGFDFCGISKACFLEDEAPRLEHYLKNNYHGKMDYMANYFDKRLDPTLLVPGAKSVVSLLFNYYTDKRQTQSDAPKISKYAYGVDYHEIIKDKLFELLACLREKIGDIDGRVFVDSAPVLDKAWAKKSGLGWVGKNTTVITKGKGSFFFIAELIIDLELTPDGPIKDYCGTCTRCIDACPTDALINPYQIDASKCISYLTIELKDELIPNTFKDKMENWAFGCDICQDVCPWNKFSEQHQHPEINANEQMLNLTKTEWYELTEDVFKTIFKKSAVKRTKYRGLKRNLNFISSS
ncbi:MAG: tRNA epoxyqueuosine(34) reductase QueG [Bacteroidia bacterium]|nr:tRNA epoxyqueuosine(34) reductase QueG [Bacteroidia bacterium]MCZ2247983.1 tRNA epoxyqueuosine(34) reductase QueG [Bacteroidia bacterium]